MEMKGEEGIDEMQTTDQSGERGFYFRLVKASLVIKNSPFVYISPGTYFYFESCLFLSKSPQRGSVYKSLI